MLDKSLQSNKKRGNNICTVTCNEMNIIKKSSIRDNIVNFLEIKKKDMAESDFSF